MDCGKKSKCLWKSLRQRRDGFLLVAFLSWLILYINCGKLSGYSDLNEKDFISLCRAALNVLITLIVLIMTYRERFKNYSVLAEHASSENDMPKLTGLFIPLALAIVPFTSAMTDLADSSEYHVLVPNLTIVLLLVITLLETSMVCEFQRSRDFIQKFTAHIFLLIVLAILLIKPSLLFSWFF